MAIDAWCYGAIDAPDEVRLCSVSSASIVRARTSGPSSETPKDSTPAGASGACT